jgi:hypothetical protein
MLLENLVVHEEKVEVEIFSVFENGLSFAPVRVVQIVQVHEVHGLVPRLHFTLFPVTLVDFADYLLV